MVARSIISHKCAIIYVSRGLSHNKTNAALLAKVIGGFFMLQGIKKALVGDKM